MGATVSRECLVIVNHSVDGKALVRAVDDYVNRSVRQFYFAVSVPQAKDNPDAWIRSFGFAEDWWIGPEVHLAIQAYREESATRFEAARAISRRQAKSCLDLLIRHVRLAGCEADGQIVSDNAWAFARVVLKRRSSIAEIIVEPRGRGLCGYSRMDFSHRIARIAGIPVATLNHGRK